MIAFFGMGLLGANFVRAALRRGEQVNVWNRTADRARVLEADGARVFDDPAEAARGATRIHLTVSDDAAVDGVLARARAGIGSAAVIVDHTTTSASGVRARAERHAREGIEFQHAPVFMGPQNARESTGTMLVSGDAQRVERLRPELEKMTGKLVYLGPAEERAAQFKLMGNLFLMHITGGVGEVLALGKAFGIEPRDAAKIFQIFNPGATLGARVSRIVAPQGAATSWELQMARKDARLMQEAATEGGVELALLQQIAAAMDRGIAAGHAREDWTVIAATALTR